MSSALPRLHFLALACTAFLSSAACAADDGLDLGAVTVTGHRPQVGAMPSDQAGSLVSAQQLRQFGRQTLGDAVALLPGVTLAHNSRNEQLVHVRGFDAREVPLFIDGVPVYVPYDGYVDFGRFTTYDLAAIQVAKGFSSIAYGPNALGGAINLVSRKPTRGFEGDAFVGMAAGRDRHAGVNLGTRQGMWYAQAGLSRRQADGFELSSDFLPTATEDGGLRENADRRDARVSLKLGLLPDAGDEYALAYTRQDGRKGQPPTTGSSGVRYWRWPMWDKESLYFVSRTAVGETESVKLRLYLDRFDNEVRSYTDASYSTLRTSGRGSVATGRSIYHDRTRGGAVEVESRRFASHLLRAVLQHKVDRHEEVDGDAVLNTRYEDRLQSFGVEDLVDLGAAWQLSLGAAHHRLQPGHVYSIGSDYALPRAASARNWQAGVFHDLAAGGRVYLTLARKTRLPTLKDRYSQRLGNYVENPGLGPERSTHAEIGYQGRPWRGLPGVGVEAALFHSRVDDKIQSVFVADGRSCSPDTPCQMRNVGEARVAGVELALRAAPSSRLEFGGNLTLLERRNLSDPDIRLTDVPDRKFLAYAVFEPARDVALQATLEHNSRRWVSADHALGEFTILGLKASWQPLAGLELETGLDNALDRHYALADGFPAAGRSWFARARYAF